MSAPMTAPSVREALELAAGILQDMIQRGQIVVGITGTNAYYIGEGVMPTIAAALATPPAPTPERIARIIDPSAFKNWQGQYDYGLKANSDEPEARRCADYFHKAACDEALAKADTILALLPDAAAIRAAAFEEAAGVADCLADEYDATSFTSTNAEQVGALRSKEQAAHEIAAAIRAAGENAK